MWDIVHVMLKRAFPSLQIPELVKKITTVTEMKDGKEEIKFVDSPGLYTAIRTFPQGSEPLVLHMMYVITEKRAPPAGLVEAVRTVHFDPKRPKVISHRA